MHKNVDVPGFLFICDVKFCVVTLNLLWQSEDEGREEVEADLRYFVQNIQGHADEYI